MTNVEDTAAENTAAGAEPSAQVAPEPAASKKSSRPNRGAHKAPKQAARKKPATSTSTKPAQDKATRFTRRKASPPRPVAARAPKPKRQKKATSAARQGTKTATLVALLERPHGATLADLMQASGWQPHSVRGFVSGTLGKKMGRTVASLKRADGQRVYSLPR